MVAGGGAFGKEHLAALRKIGGIGLAVAETRHEERRRLAAMFSLADDDADAFALLDRFRPDGVIVATPVAAHVPLAERALQRDVPVLVEKPVAPDSAAMARLCEAAAESGAFLQPGHIMRFSASHRLLLDTLRQGEIGRLLSFASRRYRDAGHAARYADVDPVLMTMIHDIDLALWFDGSAAVRARAVRRPEGTARSLTQARFESGNGAVWNLSAAWLHPGSDYPPDRVEIVGDAGSAELHVGSHIDIFGQSRRRIALEEPEDALGAELDCFLAGIRAGRSLAPVTPQDALDGLNAAEMVLDALQAR